MISKDSKVLALLSKGAASLTFLLLLASGSAQTPSFVSFDAPDAGTGSYQGTDPVAISATGLIAGNYFDSASHAHGFLRGAKGKITEFDVPGISEPIVLAINSAGQIIGYGTGLNALVHGFLRNANGRSLAVNPTGAVQTFPKAINDGGEITGFYEDKALVAHGFLRDASGTFMVIDDPEAYQGYQVGTVCNSINASGEITGNYVDKNTGTVRAFVRDAAGNFTNFDPVAGSVAAYPVSINSGGQVSGYYSTSGSRASHSFLRDPSGTVTVFDMVGAVDTYALSMNDSGVIAGPWDGDRGYAEGFRRDASGVLTSISIDGPHNRGTRALGINNHGSITGFYIDVNNVYHGFVK